MPTRSRSHELEELSVARFNDLLPPKWVSRAKLPDYGIDREVEIFDDQGRSTGLTFLVQLRATDDPQQADKVVLEADELEYYRQLDLPVMIARYCSATNGFHWQWEPIVSFRAKLKEGQKTTTYRFGVSERWDSRTPSSIQRTLEVRRSLGAFPQGAAMPVRLDLSGLPTAARYATERALGDAIAQCSGALARTREGRAVELEIACDQESITLRIDSLTSIRIDLPDADPKAVATSALYGAIKLLSHKGLHRQAERIARAVLGRSPPHHNEMLGLAACKALAGDPQAAIELALLHGFHRQTAEYGAVLFEIARSPATEHARRAATDRFYEAALEAAAEVGPANAAAIHYSFANFLRASAPASHALFHLNRARRLRPAYLRTGYFLRELGGLLFLSGHPRCAAEAYRAASERDADPLLALLLGDALMLSGSLAQAAAQFEVATAGLPSLAQAQEAELKRTACQWLKDQTGRDILPVRRKEADDAMRPDGLDEEDDLAAVLRHTDGLNPRAHFNLGVRRSEGSRRPDAVWHFLTCAFVQGGDVAAWANAAICALSEEQGELLTAILTVAIHTAGAEAYERLRTDLLDQGATADMIGALDTVAVELMEGAQARDPRHFTLRLLDGDGFDELTIIDP